MKRTALVAIAALACGPMVAGALLLRRIDPEFVSAALERRLESALALPVELGAAELTLLPLPALRIRELRIGAAPGPRLDAPQLRAELSLLALLGGEPRLTRVELSEPTLRSSAPEEAAALASQAQAGSEDSDPAPAARRLRLRVRDGAVEIGALRLEQVALEGELGAPDSVFEFEALSPQLGPLEDGHLEIGALSERVAAWRWSASAALGDVDLAALARPLGLVGLRGFATGRLAGAGLGASASSASLELASDLELQGRALVVAGRVKIAADLAGALSLDLTGAKLRVADAVEKPVGVALRIAGQLEPPLRALRLGALQIDSDALLASGRLDLVNETLDLDQASLDLEPLAAWSPPAWVPERGSVRLASARLASGEPLQATGELLRTEVPIAARASAALSGRFTTEKTRVRSDALHAELAGQTFGLSGSYDFAERWVEGSVAARGALLAPLAEALFGRKNVSGRLYGRLELSGPLQSEQLAGFGEFELRDGELPGLSFQRAAGIDAADEELPGLDRFEQISGSFTLAEQRIDLQQVTVIQAYTTALVSGPFYLQEMQADLTGAVRFDHPTLPAPSVRSILRMAGPLDRLETHISEGTTEAKRQMEARMLEAIRKVEAERRSQKGILEPPHAAQRSEG